MVGVVTKTKGRVVDAYQKWLADENNCSEDKITLPSSATFERKLKEGGGIIKAVIPTGPCNYYIKRRERPEMLTIVPACSKCGGDMTLVNKTEKYRTITLKALRQRYENA